MGPGKHHGRTNPPAAVTGNLLKLTNVQARTFYWKTSGGGYVDSLESEAVKDEEGNVISVSNEMTLTVDR